MAGGEADLTGRRNLTEGSIRTVWRSKVSLHLTFSVWLRASDTRPTA